MTEKFDEPRTIKKVEEPEKDNTFKEVRCEFRDRCFTCNEVGHMKRDFIGKCFKPITNFYCYNSHGYGHKVVECKKHKFFYYNKNSRMFRNTNLIGNGRSRSHRRYNDGDKPNGEKK